MTKILVADDEPDLEILIKQKFRQKIREQKYEFIFAPNGREALEKVKLHPDIEVILSDINMPGMDGLTFIGHVHEENPLIKTVIISAYNDISNIREAMNKGAFDFIVKPVNFDDLQVTIERTIKQVEQIKETMKAIKENNILKMYVDGNVLKFMSTRDFESSITANESVEATVAFIDICGFTSISEKEKPDVVVGLLNIYFDIIVKEIIAHGGYVDKFIGDAVMAVFRNEYHLDKAIEACVAVRKKISDLPQDQARNGYTPKVSIGINSGEMISGNVGSATLRRLDHTVIGDAVNMAQRLQSVASADQILISQAAYEKVKDVFRFTKVGATVLKNKTDAVVVYDIIG
jgi:adenylate cyclase